MNSRRIPSAWWLPGFASLIVMHAILAGQYRVAAMISPAWLAYVGMGAAMAVCAWPWWPMKWIARAKGGAGRSGVRDPGSGKHWSAWMAGAMLIAFTAVGLVARWEWIQRMPIAPELGDMLPQIQQAIQDWMNGEFPYRVHHFPWPIHLPYPPALWAAYIPATLAGVDLRCTALVCLAIMGLIWLMQFKGLAVRGASAGSLWSWSLLTGAFFLSPLILRFVIHGHTAPYWLALTALPVLLRGRQNVASAIVLGLVCAMRQPAVLFVSILGWYWWRVLSWRRAFALVGVAAATSLLFYGPFLLRDPVAVLWTPLRQYAAVGRETFVFHPAMILECIGFSPVFYLAGLERFLTVAALSIYVVVLVGNAKRMDTATDATRIMGLTTLGFVLFSPIPFYYEHMPVVILFMQAWWMEAMESADPPPNPISAGAE